MARRPRSFYAGLSFRPPEPVAAAARRALERRAQQPPSNRGMTPVGLARARQLLNCSTTIRLRGRADLVDRS